MISHGILHKYNSFHAKTVSATMLTTVHRFFDENQKFHNAKVILIQNKST